MKRNVLTGLALTIASAGLVAAIAGIAHARGTDVKMESTNLDLVLNQKRETVDRFGIPIDEATEIAITEDGDPAVRRSF